MMDRDQFDKISELTKRYELAKGRYSELMEAKKFLESCVSVGDHVEHKKYGDGIVRAVQKTTVTIEFSDTSERKFSILVTASKGIIDYKKAGFASSVVKYEELLNNETIIKNELKESEKALAARKKLLDLVRKKPDFDPNEQSDYSTLSAQEIIDRAHEYKKQGDTILAIQWYTGALEKCTKNQTAYILPCLSSCLRRIGQPEEAIKLYEEYGNKYGKSVISSALLNSVGAAYADLGMWEEAADFNRKAGLASNGPSEEIDNLRARIIAKRDDDGFLYDTVIEE